MSKTVRIYFYALALMPLWGYIAVEYLNSNPNYLFGVFSAAMAAIVVITKMFRHEKINLPNYLILLLILFFYYMAWGFNTGFATDGDFSKFLYKNSALFTFCAFFIVENEEYDEAFIKAIVRIFKVTVVLAFITTMIQVMFIRNFFIPKYLLGEDYLANEFGTVRFPSIFGYIDANAVGFSFLPILSILFGYYLVRRSKNWFWYIIPGGIVAMLASSRYIQIGFLIILFQIIFTRKERIKNTVKILAFGTVLVLVSLNIIESSGMSISDYFYGRLLGASSYSRVIGTELFARFFPEAPWLGSGSRITSELSVALEGASPYIHIGYLSHLFEYGIIGSLFLFGSWYLIGRKTFAVGSKTGYYGSFFAFLVFFFTNTTLVQYTMFHYGLIFAAVFYKYYENKFPINTERTYEKITAVS